MKNSRLRLCCLVTVLLISVQLLAQQTNPEPSSEVAAINVEDRMLTPPPVSGQDYRVGLESEEHSNLMTYGIAFSTGYSDNVLGATYGHPVSDINYSIWPSIGMNATTSRLHWDATYAAGFTLYQRTSSRNQADHSAVLGFQYRLSPHVTLSANERFQKSSSIFNQPNWGTTSVSGGINSPNNSVIAPLADRINHFATLGITYQYGADDMIGAGGSFGNLEYQNPDQIQGLSNSSTQSGSGFYTHRLTSRHYIGATYEYQRLMSYPAQGHARTQTDSLFFFYTVYPSQRASLSLFAGPQHSDTMQADGVNPQLLPVSSRDWTPAGGASLTWAGRFLSGALSYSHTVSGGSGLVSAVRLDTAAAGFRAQVSKTVRASVSGFYANNRGIQQMSGISNGHSLSGTVSIERLFAERFLLQAGYTRLHQTYGIPILAGTPDTNREFLSFSYSLSRPWGR